MSIECDLLLVRIDLLDRSLERAKKALLQRMPEPADPVARFKEQQARDRLRANFELGIEECRRTLKEARTRAGAVASLAECWSLYSKVWGQAEPLFGEILAFRLGALVREEKLDDGLLPISDELAWELANEVSTRPPITTLGESESTGDRARIIRLRFPAASIWDLPILAHEFGHVVASDERLLDIGELAKGHQIPPSLVEEYFADIFAAYAIGPALACTMLLHRLDPSNAYPSLEWSHPGDAKRAYCILETLRRMDESIQLGRWSQWVQQNVSRPWRASLAALSPRSQLEQEATAKLDRLLEEVLGALERSRISSVKYKNESWHRALSLADRLAGEHPPGDVLDDQDTVRRLLNAAWICRIKRAENPDGVRAISDRAISWCRELIRLRNAN